LIHLLKFLRFIKIETQTKFRAMKKIIPFFLAFVLTLTASTALNAQSMNTNSQTDREASFGIRGGLTFYSVETEVSSGLFGNISETSGTKLGFAVGVFAEFPLTNIFSFQPELMFVQKGGSDDGDFFDDDDFFNDDLNDDGGKLTLNYLDVPLLGRANIPLEADFTPYVVAGPSIGYLLSASIGDFDDDDIDDLFKSFNFGFIIGAGVEFGNLIVDLRYDIGLSNILDDSFLEDEFNGNDDFFDDFFSGFDFSQKTSGITLSVGLRF